MLAEQGRTQTPLDGEKDTTGQAYAWGKTARLLTETHFRQAMDDTSGKFVCVDLCSAYPIYREIMTGRHKERCMQQAVRLVGSFIHDLQSPLNKGRLPFVDRFAAVNEGENLKIFRQRLASRELSPRQLMEASIFNLIISSPHLGSSKNEESTLKNHLLSEFANSKEVHHIITEPSGKPGDKGTWGYFQPVILEATLKQALEEILGDFTDEFFDVAAGYFASRLTGRLRKISIVSLDIGDFGDMAREAEESFPKLFSDTLFFRSAAKKGRHIQAAIQALPLARESVSFYSCVEGWPFYRCGLGQEERRDIAKTITTTLKPGGRAVFFPWQMQSGVEEDLNQDRKDLAEIENFWRQEGMIITYYDCGRSELMERMVDRELTLTNHSPVFTEPTDNFVVLVVQKPKCEATPEG